MEKVYTILGWFALITLIFAIAVQLSQTGYIYLFPDAWGKPFAHGRSNNGQAGREGFTNFPANANAPYRLLADVLPEKQTDGTLTAQTCYQRDFLAQTEKTGNYIQRTNNFRHGTPDNCSAPLTEMVDSFYKNPTL